MSLIQRPDWPGLLASISLAMILTPTPGAAEAPGGDSKIEEIVITGKTPVPQSRRPCS